MASMLNSISVLSSSLKKIILILSLYIAASMCVNIPKIPTPPTMIKEPRHEQLFQVSQSADVGDKPFTLNCEARGYPQPRYYWQKNGKNFTYEPYDKRISQQPKRGTLVFTKPDDVDEGLYQCFAHNNHGKSVSNSVFLRKSELNSFPDEEPEENVVNAGEPYSIECNPPTGYPKPSIFWMILSRSGALRSINSSRMTVDPEGRLHFSNTTKRDELLDGMYACSATSFFRTEYKIGKKIRLVVKGGAGGTSSHAPSRQYVSPPNVPTLRGQRLELHCIYGGTPLPDIQWSRKGGSLDDERHHFVNFGKTLVIPKVDFQDEGTYQCQASNGVGSQKTHAMTVKVKAAPYWKISPNNTNAAEHETVSFKCDAGGLPEPKLEWFMNGIPLTKITPDNRRVVEGNTMVIRGLVKSDTAVFQCNASNAHGYAFKDFYLNILALPPIITQKPDNVTTAVDTSTAILKCRVFGAPKPEVRWFKDGVQLTGGRYQVLDDGDLEISRVLTTDAGSYKCFAANKLGETQEYGILKVVRKTRIAQRPENIELAAGKMAVFRCTAEADQSLKLDILWAYNGKTIDFEENQRMVKAADNSLTISNTIELDSGSYTCTAKTALDQDEASATLTVQDVPNPPKILGVECNSKTATVTWTPTGDRRAPILGYAIQYNTSFTPSVWTDAHPNIPAQDNTFTVSMSPWSNYTFRVIARNKIGPSLPSKPGSPVCTTDEEIPYKNPEKVVGRGDRPDNLVIKWTPMPQIEHNAPGFFYKVYWKRSDGRRGWESKVIKDWKTNTHTVYNQPTYVPYKIKVEAHNKVGQAHTVPTEKDGFSGEDKPLEAPNNFRLMEIKGPKSAKVSWRKVEPNSIQGEFKGYKIQAWPEGARIIQRKEMIVPNTTEEAIINILKPYSVNYVQVLSFNGAYNGPPSTVLKISTPEGRPGPVASFDAIQMGSSAFYLIWEPPQEINGILQGYRIFYEEVHGTQLGSMLEKKPPIGAKHTKAKLSGLKSDTKYRVTIKAFTNAGSGDKYYIETRTRNDEATEPDVPGLIINNIDGEDVRLTDVKVTWLPNISANKPGSHFYAQWRKKGETAFQSSNVEYNKDYVVLKGLENDIVHEIRVVSIDGNHQTPSPIKTILAGKVSPTSSSIQHPNIGTTDWLIGLICAIALIIVCAIFVCIVKRNRGGKYDVQYNEGRHNYQDEGGFEEYVKPRGGHGGNVGSRASLTEHQDDTDSMTDYGEDDSSKFGEDGSFIGQYGTKKPRIEPPTPTGVATFV